MHRVDFIPFWPGTSRVCGQFGIKKSAAARATSSQWYTFAVKWGRPDALFLGYFLLPERLFSRTGVRPMVHFCVEVKKELRSLPVPTMNLVQLPSDPRKPYQLPQQKREMLKHYWPVRHAARRWGCTYRAARLYILRHPEIAVQVRVQHTTAPKPRWIVAVRAGTAKIPAMKGNPDMLDPHWQRENALKRWARRRAGERPE